MATMTLEDIEAMEGEIITADIAAKILQCNPAYIRVAARQCPERLGFPVSVCGHRVRIPRRAFISFMRGTTA